jgi:hypothetical protein
MQDIKAQSPIRSSTFVQEKRKQRYNLQSEAQLLFRRKTQTDPVRVRKLNNKENKQTDPDRVRRKISTAKEMKNYKGGKTLPDLKLTQEKKL